MIKKTTKENPHKILSAYKDNVAFSQGPMVEQFAPADQSTSDWFQVKEIESVISLKAETQVARFATVWAVASAHGLSPVLRFT